MLMAVLLLLLLLCGVATACVLIRRKHTTICTNAEPHQRTKRNTHTHNAMQYGGSKETASPRSSRSGKPREYPNKHVRRVAWAHGRRCAIQRNNGGASGCDNNRDCGEKKPAAAAASAAAALMVATTTQRARPKKLLSYIRSHSALTLTQTHAHSATHARTHALDEFFFFFFQHNQPKRMMIMMLPHTSNFLDRCWV